MKSWIPFPTPILTHESNEAVLALKIWKVLWVSQWYGGWFRNPFWCIKPCKLRGCTTNLNWWVNPGVLVAINSSYFKKTWGKMVGKPLGCFCFPLIPSTPYTPKTITWNLDFFIGCLHLRHEKKKLLLSMSHPGWFMTGSLCHGLWNNPCIGVVFHPLYNPTNQGPFFFRAYLSFLEEWKLKDFSSPRAPPAANVRLLAFRVLHAPDPQKCRKHPRNPGGSPGSLTARPWKNDG